MDLNHLIRHSKLAYNTPYNESSHLGSYDLYLLSNDLLITFNRLHLNENIFSWFKLSLNTFVSN